MSDVDVRVEEDPSAALARRLVAAVRARAVVGLSGGSSPRRAYALAAEAEPDWSRSEVWLVDERCVPPDDERSNYRLVRATVLDRLAHAPRAAHRVEGELEPAAAARRYDDALAGVQFDLAVMGLGPDGHTASLFPHAPQLDVRERRAVAAEAGLEPYVPRVTTTIPFLATAAELVYLVTGADKADAVRRAFADPPSPATPASLVRGRRTVVLLDPAAASRLHP